MSEAVNKLMMMMCYMLAACCDNMSEWAWYQLCCEWLRQWRTIVWSWSSRSHRLELSQGDIPWWHFTSQTWTQSADEASCCWWLW